MSHIVDDKGNIYWGLYNKYLIIYPTYIRKKLTEYYNKNTNNLYFLYRIKNGINTGQLQIHKINFETKKIIAILLTNANIIEDGIIFIKQEHLINHYKNIILDNTEEIYDLFPICELPSYFKDQLENNLKDTIENIIKHPEYIIDIPKLDTYNQNLGEYINTKKIDINQKIYDPIVMEDISIKDHIQKENSFIALLDNNINLLSVDSKNLTNTQNQFHLCISSETTKKIKFNNLETYIRIDFLGLFCRPDIIININDIRSLLHHHIETSKYYILVDTNIKSRVHSLRVSDDNLEENENSIDCSNEYPEIKKIYKLLIFDDTDFKLPDDTNVRAKYIKYKNKYLAIKNKLKSNLK